MKLDDSKLTVPISNIGKAGPGASAMETTPIQAKHWKARRMECSKLLRGRINIYGKISIIFAGHVTKS